MQIKRLLAWVLVVQRLGSVSLEVLSAIRAGQTVLLGGTSIKHIRENVKALRVVPKLTPEIMARIEAVRHVLLMDHSVIRTRCIIL